MIEMQFGDFITCGFNQIVNNLAKTHYRWGAAVPVVVRVPVGGGTGAGPFHSQNVEAWFTHVAGLKVVAPATPYDAKGLLTAAFEDGNPVLYLEHKLLYRSAKRARPRRLVHAALGPGADCARRHGRHHRDLLGRRVLGPRRRRAPGRGGTVDRGDRPPDAAALGPRDGARVRAQDGPRPRPPRSSDRPAASEASWRR